MVLDLDVELLVLFVTEVEDIEVISVVSGCKYDLFTPRTKVRKVF